ncbi:MAG: histidinol-phosphate transaminase [Anaerolineales bacterium]|nr:histidinol-phosphate transaminase [Anaerolineales bacterium]
MQIRPHIGNMPPYTPIEPFEVLSARLGRPPEQIIKLDANENPYGPLPAVRQALADLPFLHIYPDPESRALRKGIAEFIGVPMESILAGAGADELIDLLMRVFLEPGDGVIVCPPTFGMYDFDGRLNNAKVIEVPRREDFSLDLPALCQIVHRERPKLLFLATPNNPDGSLPPADELDEVLELPVLVVLDEAYIEFADPHGELGGSLSRVGEVLRRHNLVVLRTFSKLAALAGLRVGYGVFPDWLMPTLWKAKQPYNVNVAATTAALAALEHAEQMKDVVKRVIAERGRMADALSRYPFFSLYPSQANYLLMRVRGIEAAELKRRLMMDYGILVRYFSTPRLRNCIRISVGKPQDTEALLRALDQIAQEVT